MDNPGNRRPVWNPSPSGASHSQYIQSAAAESSTSVSESTSRRFPALAAAANPYPSSSYQQRSLQGTTASQSHYQGMFGLTGAQGQTYQPVQSSFSQSAAGDYREMPSGSGSEQSSYSQSLSADFREIPSGSGTRQSSYSQSSGADYREMPSGSGTAQSSSYGQSAAGDYRDIPSDSVQSSYSQSSGADYREMPSGSRSGMSSYSQSTADYRDIPTGSVSAHSSYSQSSVDEYRDLPTGSDEASSYPILRIGEVVRVQGQPVNSTTVSQSVSYMKYFEYVFMLISLRNDVLITMFHKFGV